MFSPDLETIKKIDLSEGYKVVPVKTEILSDVISPIELLRKLKKVSRHCFILESVEEQKTWGRYTFLGYKPKAEITCLDGNISIRKVAEDGTKEDEVINQKVKHPKESIEKLLEEYKSASIEGFPTFTGGLTGYFSYDYIKYCEPKLKLDAKDEENFNDVDLMLFDKVIAFDNLKQKIVLITNMKLDKDENKLKANYEKAKEELNEMKDLIAKGEKADIKKGKLKSDFRLLFDRERFYEMINKAKRYIYEGDIFQVVLSNRMEAEYEGSLLNVYRTLRTINPSPYMFYFSSDDMEVAGASPETLVKLEDKVLHTFPLAGTRKRGATKEEDLKLEKELLADEKECAEHNMLVDLGRNDLGKISKFGTVEVEKYMSIERYSHVMHIGSTVRGEIEDNKGSLDAIDAVLPAGTLSGAPKIRACEIINELENNKRGIYGGAIGYIDFKGNLDTCIAIRLAFKKNGKIFVRSGAGIVADSVPEKEFEECVNKAKAVVTAIEDSDELM
ncbi:MAG: anthranilate synthase component I [Lachnospiraceae bacterium]|nr:anthranilate synthase component I [Lachnospiraceae bacterium]